MSVRRTRAALEIAIAALEDELGYARGSPRRVRVLKSQLAAARAELAQMDAVNESLGRALG